MDNVQLTHAIFEHNGFVYANDLEELKLQDNAHAFRLVWDKGNWTIYFSFFSGQLCARVSFPGPNQAPWNSAFIEVPIKNPRWNVTTTKLILPISGRINWHQSEVIAPTCKIKESQSHMIVEPRLRSKNLKKTKRV